MQDEGEAFLQLAPVKVETNIKCIYKKKSWKKLQVWSARRQQDLFTIKTNIKPKMLRNVSKTMLCKANTDLSSLSQGWKFYFVFANYLNTSVKINFRFDIKVKFC